MASKTALTTTTFGIGYIENGVEVPVQKRSQVLLYKIDLHLETIRTWLLRYRSLMFYSDNEEEMTRAEEEMKLIDALYTRLVYPSDDDETTEEEILELLRKKIDEVREKFYV